MDARELLDRVCEVSPLPATTQRVLALLEDPNASYAAVGRAVAGDPALAAEVMRLARSPVHAAQVPVDDLEAATRRLGLAELRDMASAMAMLAAFRSEHELALRIHDQAVIAGTLARAVAAALGHRRPATVYLSGLLCEIGALACFAVDPEGYGALRGEAGDRADMRAYLERARYGATSWELGAAFLRRNRLPDSVCAAVAADPDGDDVLAVSVTYFVRRAVPEIVAASRDGDPEWLERTHATARSVGIDLDAETLAQVVLSAGAEALDELHARG